MEGIIYRTPKKKVLRKLERDIKALLFDVDGTLIDFSLNFPGLEFPTSWQVMEIAIGLDKNEKFQRYFRKWIELSKEQGSKELEKINKKIGSFWKGKHKKEVSKYLYPIPFLDGVKFFFDKLQKVNEHWELGLISSAPDFYVREIANLLKISYFDACEVGVDRHNFLTGEFGGNGLYGKKSSLETFCQKFSLKPSEIAYHGDSKPDIAVLSSCGLGIAVNPHKKFEQEVIEVSDVVLYSWYKHPLIELL
ncbi:MAG: haloacid dehalogenase-like hydrolase [Candidatus Pacearchaeota archaeon]|nr:haloacid dehalogenase-like hydrolase [Candidatus Pacearchaeota archaeon]